MKRTVAVIIALMMTVLFLYGCGGDEKKAVQVNYEVGFVVNDVMLEDDSVNEAIWKGIIAFGEENAVAHKYFVPAECTTDGYLASVNDAVKSGVNVVVMSGENMIEALNRAEKKYKKIDFIYIDEAMTANGIKTHDMSLKKNTMMIKFAEEQAGYLAGYAAVRDGYRQLGFMGGDETFAVKNYGIGFVQGAEEAAREVGVTNLTIRYKSMKDLKAQKIEKTAISWYRGGTKVIFACGDRIDDYVMDAADKTDGKIIGADVDKSGESETVLTSAIKAFDTAIEFSLQQHFDGDFKGGKTYRLTVEESGVGLPLDSSDFEDFSKDEYSEVYERLQDKILKVKNSKQIALKQIDLKIVDLKTK